jgi:hypothetical protein
LQTSRPFLSPHATTTALSTIRISAYQYAHDLIDMLTRVSDRQGGAESKGAGLNRVHIREVASGRERDVRTR